MSVRHLRLWVTLPPPERRMRTGKVLERWLRRMPAARRLGISPDQPRWGSLKRALGEKLDVIPSRLRAADSSRGVLHGDLAARAAAIALKRPGHASAIVRQAEGLLDRRFDLLGSGPSRPLLPDGSIDWALDWKSGLKWDESIFYLDVVSVRGDGSDIKVPWEISRFQHLLVLGQAFQLAPHLARERSRQDLSTRCAREAASQIDAWILKNPRGVGVNWACTMEVAIRAANWVAALGLFRTAPEWDDRFLRRLVRALWTHGRHIRRNLEVGGDGLTSNHFLSDLIGLYAVGTVLPELRDAADWRSFARDALQAEIERQVFPDGVDFERSIPYHRLVTEIFVHGALLARAEGKPMPAPYLGRLSSMLEFIAAYTRPDGSAPQWGDNDDGRLLPLEGYASHAPHDHRHLLAVGGRLLGRADLAAAGAARDIEALWILGAEPKAPVPSPVEVRDRAFESAAYYIQRTEDLHAAISCGGVGTRGLGNHSHNDLFSLCIWAGGNEWITDPGTGTYSGDPALRNRLRSTSAHATLQLGEREQNPFGHARDDLFRMHERARPRVLQWISGTDDAYLEGRHEGFTGQDGVWVHQRAIRFRRRRREWIVVDHLWRETPSHAGVGGREPVFVRFPLALGIGARIVMDKEEWPSVLWPSLREIAASCGEGTRRWLGIELDSPAGSRFWIVLDLPKGSALAVERGLSSPRYGVVERSIVLVASIPGADSVTAGAVLYSPPGGASGA